VGYSTSSSNAGCAVTGFVSLIREATITGLDSLSEGQGRAVIIHGTTNSICEKMTLQIDKYAHSPHPRLHISSLFHAAGENFAIATLSTE